MSRWRPQQDERDSTAPMTLDLAEAGATQALHRAQREVEEIQFIRQESQAAAEQASAREAAAAELREIRNAIATAQRELADVQGSLAEAKATSRRDTERLLGEQTALGEETRKMREQRDAVAAELDAMRRRFS